MDKYLTTAHGHLTEEQAERCRELIEQIPEENEPNNKPTE